MKNAYELCKNFANLSLSLSFTLLHATSPEYPGSIARNLEARVAWWT